MSQWENYFGFTDAGSPDDHDFLEASYLARAKYEEIKYEDREAGKSLIIGIKGSGKTAIRRHVAAQTSGPVWILADGHYRTNLDAAAMDAKSGEVRDFLCLEILRQFTDQVGDDDGPEWKKKLRSIGSGTLEVLKQAPNAVKLEGFGAQVDLGELLASGGRTFLSTQWMKTLDEVVECVGDQRACILIDDAESVFKNLEQNTDFIEGLAWAVEQINARAKSSLHVLLFLKHGIYRRWYEKQREYDKFSYAMEHLTWAESELWELLARRIKARRGIDDLEAEELGTAALWAQEFSCEESFEEFARSFSRLCASGPRDMVDLANRCKKLAEDDSITLEHLAAIESKYSEDKLYAIHADFEDVYPRINEFVGYAFAGCPSTGPASEYGDAIEAKVLGDVKVFDDFSTEGWFRNPSMSRLLRLMFEVGVVGIKRGDTVTYAIEDPDLAEAAHSAETLVVHPAFRSHLGCLDK
ncbi:MAG: hypothetical protein GKS06_00020 [Acidobacteria bacterium]|nr:hypothetical protein [Acidobacteriota bacterium]